MRPPALICAVIAVIAGAAGLYALKHEVEERRAAVAALERQMAEDREALRVLKAEWAYLDSPQMIQERALRHLRLRPPTPDQFLPVLGMLPLRNDRTPFLAASAHDVVPRPTPRFRPTPPVRKAVAGGGERGNGAFSARMKRALERVGGTR